VPKKRPLRRHDAARQPLLSAGPYLAHHIQNILFKPFKQFNRCTPFKTFKAEMSQGFRRRVDSSSRAIGAVISTGFLKRKSALDFVCSITS
jgi:hypothetical protein